jgi:uncharacterized protein (DUF2141 family)
MNRAICHTSLRRRDNAGTALPRLAGFAIATALASSSVALSADLTVTVDGVRSAKGAVILELDNSDAQWDNKAAPFATGNINAQAGSVVYVFRDLKAGKYSVGVFHDENDNGKFDSNFLGIPKESWGFSNNPKGPRKASFDEASFFVDSENLAITIHLMRVM